MLRPLSHCVRTTRLLSDEIALDSLGDRGKLKKIGKALETYIKHSSNHIAMMAKERADYELGRRHLANMMSVEAHTLTQKEVDEAIEYLFPSGLSDLKARPVMRPPDEIFPRFHRFLFDNEGRPQGSRFFTLRPKFYGVLSEIGVKSHSVNAFFNDHVTSGLSGAELQPINLNGTQWLNKEKLEKKLNEKITTEMYAQVLLAFNHLISLPGSSVHANFIMEFRESLASSTGSKLFGPMIPDVTICTTTNKRIATTRTKCKSTQAEVTVSDAGSGQFSIDGHGLHDFQQLIAREVLLSPLLVSGFLGHVDVFAITSGSGGVTAIPRAVRHGAALCIAALYPKTTEALRLAGLLTSDPRKKERSKVNQPGARAKWIWKRR